MVLNVIIFIAVIAEVAGFRTCHNLFHKYLLTSSKPKIIFKAASNSVIQPLGPGEVYDDVPDMASRKRLNAILLGAVGVTTLSMAIPYLAFFVPPSAGGGANGVIAKDAVGNDVTVASWKETHVANARDLVQGLKGDATYLILDENKELVNFGLNAVCTHLGCVVPWNKAENKFICPCHGSQYDKNGKVVRGPAPLSLALEHVEQTEDGKIVFKPWTETDFRTGTPPWWK